MSKCEISKKQSELKSWLKRIGLSQNDFSALFLEETYDYVTEEEIEKFQESFKKQINRDSTSPERLETYLDFLFSTQKFKESGYVRSQSCSDGILTASTEKMMKKVSKELTDKFKL